MRRCSPGAVLLIALLTLAGCGAAGSAGNSGGSTTSNAASSSATSSTGSPTPPTSGGGGSGGGSNGGSGGTGGGGSNSHGGGGGNGGFAYTPWGPDDAPIPQQYQSMAASPGNPPQCSNVKDSAPPGDAFWDTVVQVCQAITVNGPWPSAVPGPSATDNKYLACLDQDIVRMLHRALDWHERHPGKQPEVAYPSRSGTSKCQGHLYGVKVFDPTADTPPAVPILFNAPGLEGQTDPTVTVDGKVFEDQSQNGVVDTGNPGDGLTPVVVLVPGEADSRTVKIKVQTAFGTASGTAKVPALDSDLTTSTTTTTSSDGSSDEPASETTS